MLSGKKGAWRGRQGHGPPYMCAVPREGCFLPACGWNNLFKMVRDWHGSLKGQKLFLGDLKCICTEWRLHLCLVRNVPLE